MVDTALAQTFDEVHKIANNLVKDAPRIQIPFVNYTQTSSECIVLAIVPGPCPEGYEAKLKSLIDKNVGFKCTVREDDLALVVATYMIEMPGNRDGEGCAVNNCEFAIENDESLKDSFERLIDETASSIKTH